MKGPNRAGWSQDVQPYKEASVRCHTIWTEYGEPQAGEVYDNMKETKRQFAYACRRMRRRERYIRNERMVEAIAENRSRDMWSEVKKANGKRSSPPNIDGVSDPKDIADLFRNKYEKLYNCNPPDKYNMVKIGEYIEKGIMSSDLADYTANEGDVVKAVS